MLLPAGSAEDCVLAVADAPCTALAVAGPTEYAWQHKQKQSRSPCLWRKKLMCKTVEPAIAVFSLRHTSNSNAGGVDDASASGDGDAGNAGVGVARHLLQLV